MLEYNHCYIKASCHGQHTGPVTQKESILEGKVCIEHVIFWWKTRSCAEKGARDRMLMAVVVLSHYTLLITWAFVVVRYDPMICCVLHARVHTAERHQPTPPPPPPPPPSPWLLARCSSKGLALVYSMQHCTQYIPTHGNRNPVTEPRQLWPSILYLQIVLN